MMELWLASKIDTIYVSFLNKSLELIRSWACSLHTETIIKITSHVKSTTPKRDGFRPMCYLEIKSFQTALVVLVNVMFVLVNVIFVLVNVLALYKHINVLAQCYNQSNLLLIATTLYFRGSRDTYSSACVTLRMNKRPACTKLYWLLYSDWFTSYLISALISYHSHLILSLNHVVIVVNLCCVKGLMEDRCISNTHSR